MKKHVYQIAKWLLNYNPLVNHIYKGKTKISNGKLMLGCTIKSKGKNNRVIFGNGGALIKTVIHIDGDNNYIYIGDGASVRYGVLWIEDSNNKILIGNNTHICGHTQLACIEGTTIEIGKDCLFSSDVTIRTGDSHSLLDLNGTRINPSQDVKVGNLVWLCNDVKILSGVNICNDVVIGTGSIVTHNVSEEKTVVAGVPAKIINRNVIWDEQRL